MSSGATGMFEIPIVLREVSIADSDFFRHVRNQWSIVAVSNGRRVGEVEHDRWFRPLLESSNNRLFILQFDGVDVGTLRLDYEGVAATIHIALLDEFQSRGLGSRFVLLGVSKAFGDGCKVVRAKVRVWNLASSKCFFKAGFVHSGGDEEFVSWELRK